MDRVLAVYRADGAEVLSYLPCVISSRTINKIHE